MKIDNNTNISFRALRIDNAKFSDMRHVCQVLELNNFEFIGNENVYISRNNRKEIVDTVKSVRSKYLNNMPFEFGAVYFPWSNQGYILSSPRDEQIMYAIIKDFKPETKINLLL